MNDLRPWEVHPALTLDRLGFIGNLLARVRDEVNRHVQPERGDLRYGAWVSGTTAHARFTHAVEQLVLTGEYSWLSVVDATIQFSFAIEGVPIRVYRGEPEKPSRGAQKKSMLEAIAQYELFTMEEIVAGDLDWQWRIAVETEPSGDVFRITLCQVNVSGPEVQVRNLFEIPFRDESTGVSIVSRLEREGVELPPPLVTELTAAEENAEGESSHTPQPSTSKGHGKDG